MGKVDIAIKDYMKDSQRFADAFNYYLFGGQQIICAEKLQEMDPSELGILLEEKRYTEKIRDLLRDAVVLTDERYTYLLLGLENQDKVHMAMPVKNMVMDALRYGDQVSQQAKARRKDKNYGDSAEFLSGFGRQDKLKPVITLVIYWNDGSWDGPRSLYEMFDYVEEWMRDFVNDYKIHIIVPDEVQDFCRFQTELGQALEFISVSRSEEGIRSIEKNKRFSEVSNETVNLLNICTGAELKLNQKGASCIIQI